MSQWVRELESWFGRTLREAPWPELPVPAHMSPETALIAAEQRLRAQGRTPQKDARFLLAREAIAHRLVFALPLRRLGRRADPADPRAPHNK